MKIFCFRFVLIFMHFLLFKKLKKVNIGLWRSSFWNMSSLEKKWEDLDITKDEVISITEALKNEDFRKLLVEYVKDTQSPESRKKYQDDIVQLEAERGVLCSFVNPVPGFVIKTSIDGVKKAFINVCSNPLVGKPVSKPMTTENSRGLSWSIPYSQDPGRDDYDKKNNRCIVYDVIFHPDTLHLAQNNKQFKDMVINTALKGVENTFSVKLDHRNIKLPKLKYKGVPNPSVIRRKSKTPVNLAEEDLEFHKKFEYPTSVPETPRAPTVTTFGDEEVKEYTTPHYLVKHRTDIDVQEFTENRHAKMNAAIPKELVIEIHLPLLKSTKDVNLDILEKSLELVCEKPARYKLNLELPYAVSQNGNAKFDTDKRILVVTLPVLRRSQNCSDYIREDSGVESDNGEHVVPENNSENPDEVKNSENIKETFLDVDQHYVLPSFDCNRENNSICFILNVKNVDPSSIKTKNLDRGFLIKFTSVGSGYFPIHYAFCAKFDSDLAEDIGVEAWDNNVTVQVQMSYLGSKGSILVGLNEEELEEKRLQDITDLTGSAEGEKEEERRENDISVVSVAEEEVVFDVDMGGRESSPEDISDEASQHIPELPSKMRTYSEGSGDEVVNIFKALLIFHQIR